MKTPPASSRLPFACRVARQWSAVSGSAPAHAQNCPSCRAFFAAGDALENALRREAPRQRATAPAGFEQRLVHAVQRAARTAPEPAPRTRSRVGVLAFAALTASAALAFMVLRQPAAQNTTAPQIAPATMAAANTVMDAISFEAIASLRPEAEALLRQDPLRAEADAVVSGARSAVRFLALNFLPAQPETPRDRG